MESSNPTFSAFDKVRGESGMTATGTALKTLLLFAVLCFASFYTWDLATSGYAESFQPDAANKYPDQIDIPANVYGLASLGVFGGFVLALVIIFNPRTAPFLAPVYAGLEGLALGAISAGFEAKYPGIVTQAVGASFGVFVGMLFLYLTGILRASQFLWGFVLSAMLGILALYLVDMVLSFGGAYVPIVHDNSWGSITIQFFIVGIAALNFTLDFGQIETQCNRGAPKYMEWYGGFSLMVTFVWLYLEILRLLAKVKSKNN